MRSDGNAPILGRIIVNGQMAHFSTKCFCNPDNWVSADNRTDGKTAEGRQTNKTLQEFVGSVQRYYYDMQASGEPISAAKLKAKMFCTDVRQQSLRGTCTEFITEYDNMHKLSGYGEESLRRYKLIVRRLDEFLQDVYHTNDILLSDIDRKFFEKFYVWLRTEHNIGNNTSIKLVQKVITIYRFATDKGWVNGRPYLKMRMHFDKVDRGYLTEDEIQRIYNKEFATPRLEAIRDVFVFSCYTGLAYIDVQELTKANIVTWPDGSQWIQTKRHKTQVEVNVPLLEIPKMILKKYEGKCKGDALLPIPTNQKCNNYLKEIADVCGITKNLTFHMARHTFATTVTLANGVPIESVSKMLGHTNIITTQIYARITNQKIQNDMQNLSAKIEKAGEEPAPLPPSAAEQKICGQQNESHRMGSQPRLHELECSKIL